MFHTAVKLLPYMKYLTSWRSLRGRDHMVIGLTLPVQSVPIATKVVSLNPTHSEAYSIQHYVAKFLSDLRQVGGFLWVLLFPPPIKLTPMI